MIVRDQPSIFKVLFSWRGTILPKVLPPLGVVMLVSAIIGILSYVGYFHFPELPLVGFTLIGVVLSIVKLLYYSYKIRKKLEITHRLSRSTILYAYV